MSVKKASRLSISVLRRNSQASPTRVAGAIFVAPRANVWCDYEINNERAKHAAYAVGFTHSYRLRNVIQRSALLHIGLEIFRLLRRLKRIAWIDGLTSSRVGPQGFRLVPNKNLRSTAFPDFVWRQEMLNWNHSGGV